MFTLILNGVFGVLVSVMFTATGWSHWGWSILWGFLAFAAGQGLCAYLFQRRVKVAMATV
jgi:hypothetical protein